MKEKLKQNKIIRKMVQIFKVYVSGLDYIKDFFCFKKNYMYAKNDLKNLEYRSLLLIHSIEKGFLYKEIRPFGKYKIIELIENLNKISLIDKKSFSFIVGVNLLRHYANLYEQNNWTNKDEYIIVNVFLEKMLT